MLFWKHERFPTSKQNWLSHLHLWKYPASSHTWTVATTLSTPKLHICHLSQLPKLATLPNSEAEPVPANTMASKPGARSVDFFLEPGYEHTRLCQVQTLLQLSALSSRHRTATDDTAGVGDVFTEKEAMGWRWGLEAPEAAKASARHPGIVIHTPSYASTYDRFPQESASMHCLYDPWVCVIISLIPNYKTRPLRMEPLLHPLTDLQWMGT